MDGVQSVADRALISLGSGGGPAQGARWQCGPASGGAFSCGGSHPGGSSVQNPQWYNQTFYMHGSGVGGTQYRVYDAAAAYDPDLNEIVLFGGCSKSQCPSNQTWFYDGNAWVNATSFYPISPPAVLGESLAWDPARDLVVLVGGTLSSYAYTDNETWGLSLGGWENLTPTVGAVGEPAVTGGVAFASMAYDDALGELVLVDGCANVDCSLSWDAEWALGKSGAWVHVGLGPTGYATGNGSADEQVWNASMAYDTASREMVFFGGEGSVTRGPINLTYVLSGGGWANITSTSSSCTMATCYYPPARSAAAMTWDAQLNEVVLFGGRSATLQPMNDTWYFSNGEWLSTTVLGSINEPPATYGAAMPTNSTNVTPAVYGGQCVAGCLNQSWVYETAPEPLVYRVAPRPADLGAVVNVTGDNSPNTGSGPSLVWELYDNYGNGLEGSFDPTSLAANESFAANFTYYLSGIWNISCKVVDYYGVTGAASTVPITVVSNVSLAVRGTPNPSEVGSPIDFSAGTELGTAPYTYSWEFGEVGAAVSHQASPTFAYDAAGSYNVSVNVSDAGGGWNNTTIDVSVLPVLTATATSNATPTTDIGLRVGFEGFPVGGSGVYSNYTWQFGDGTVGYGVAPSHGYAAAGGYRANLTVTDSVGFTAKAVAFVTVSPPIAAEIALSTTTPPVGAAVGFIGGQSGGSPTFTYRWSFGDGSPNVTGEFLSHSYSSAGSFLVTMTVTDRFGERSSTSVVVTVSSGASPWSELLHGVGLDALLAAIVLGAAALLVWGARRRRRAEGTSGESRASDRDGSADGQEESGNGGSSND